MEFIAEYWVVSAAVLTFLIGAALPQLPVPVIKQIVDAIGKLVKKK